jgi:putative ATP-dependent endonuclease of OLD family
MAVKKLTVKNYRSIEDLELNLSPLNAIIGPNNAGKSNILRAINVILGDTWPSRPFSDKDFYGADQTRTIEITAMFDAPLESDSSVNGFSLRYDMTEGVQYFPIDADGDRLYYSSGYEKRVNAVMRSEVSLMYLDLDRHAEKQLRPSQWTLYGKLLKEIDRSIDGDKKAEFSKALQEAFDTYLRPKVDPSQKIINEFVRKQTGLDVDLSLQILDPHAVLKSLRPYIIDPPMTVDPEDVGAGVQSALAIAIAKAYMEIVKKPLLLAIEEPELYLHPHGCRHFYKVLRELSEGGLQILYTTHDRSFLNAGDFRDIHIIRKPHGATVVTSGISITGFADAQDPLRLQARFNERLNELFFASCVVLVEGEPDEIACRSALEHLGLELDKQSISIMSLGGRGEVYTVARLLVALQIPTMALVDEDPGNPVAPKQIAKIESVIGKGNTFLQSPDLEGLFGLPKKPTRVDAMTLFPQYFGDPSNTTPAVYNDIVAAIEEHIGADAEDSPYTISDDDVPF